MNTLVKVQSISIQSISISISNSRLIQQKCNIKYYPDLNPEPQVLNAGKYLPLGNFP